MRRRARHLGLALAAAMMVAAAPGRAETLGDALVDAYRNSNLLEQNRALLRAADEKVGQAVARLRPILSFIAQANRQVTADRTTFATNIDSTSASLDLSVRLNVWDGGANRIAVRSAKESVLATRQQLIDVEQRVLLDAVNAYVEVRLALENVRLLENNVGLNQEELQAVRDRFSVGEVTLTDVAQAEAALAAARSQLAAERGNLGVAEASFKAAVGRAPDALRPISDLPEVPASVEEAVAIAERRHPAIKAAQRQVTVAALGLARARAVRGPRIDVTGSLGRRDTDTTVGTLGIELSQEIYSGGALKSAEREALANQEASLANLHQTVLTISRQVRNAWASLESARARITATNAQVEAAQLAYEGVSEEARLGARTTLDVLDLEQDLLNAQTDRVEARANRDAAVFALLAATGFLTADHLGLDVPAYDPEAYYRAVKGAPLRSVRGDRIDKVLESLGRK